MTRLHANTSGPVATLPTCRATGDVNLANHRTRHGEPLIANAGVIHHQHFRHWQGTCGPDVGCETASLQAIAEAFATAGHAVALIGFHGYVVFFNRRFERLIGDGVNVKAGRLSSWQNDADNALTTAIQYAIGDRGAQGSRATVILPRRDARRPLAAQVVPVKLPHNAIHSVAAIVMLADLEFTGSKPAEKILAQAFGLTPAEARLASQITDGKTLAQISLQGGGTRETLRSLLKTIFKKTATRRQAELILLLSKIAA